jgi:hypothetical protein
MLNAYQIKLSRIMRELLFQLLLLQLMVMITMTSMCKMKSATSLVERHAARSCEVVKSGYFLSPVLVESTQ